MSGSSYEFAGTLRRPLLRIFSLIIPPPPIYRSLVRVGSLGFHLSIIGPGAYFGRVGPGSNDRSRATCLIGPTIWWSNTAK